MKTFDLVSPYNVIRSIKAPKTHSIIFSKSTIAVTTTVSRVSSQPNDSVFKNKNVFKPIFDTQGCTFNIAKETFVHIYQN